LVICLVKLRKLRDIEHLIKAIY